MFRDCPSSGRCLRLNGLLARIRFAQISINVDRIPTVSGTVTMGSRSKRWAEDVQPIITTMQGRTMSKARRRKAVEEDMVDDDRVCYCQPETHSFDDDKNAPSEL